MKIFLLYMRNISFFLCLWLSPTRRRNVHSCLLAILEYSIAWTWMPRSNQLKMRHSTCTVLGVQEVFSEPVIPGKNKVCYCKSCQKTKKNIVSVYVRENMEIDCSVKKENPHRSIWHAWKSNIHHHHNSQISLLSKQFYKQEIKHGNLYQYYHS